MGIFSKLFKKKLEPRLIEVTRDDTGRFTDVKVELVKATTDNKPTTIPSEYAKAVVEKQKAASKSRPSKLEQVKADAERMSELQNKSTESKKAPVKKPSAKKKPKSN